MAAASNNAINCEVGGEWRIPSRAITSSPLEVENVKKIHLA
jgi:hypothetical protein